MIVKDKKKYIEEISNLQLAYNRVFDKNSPHVQMVLKDLEKFCRANKSTFHPNEAVHRLLEGRREVWLKIQEFLNMTIDELYRSHTIKEIGPSEGEDEERV